MESRLDRCFAAVFPDLPASQIRSATIEAVKGWDSVATATLITTIEEEFGIEFDVETIGELTSYSAIQAALQKQGEKSL
jgi:acyl carrier protein